MVRFVNVKVREWHFVVLILLLTVVIHILGSRNSKHPSIFDGNDYLIELNEETFLENISSRLCFILFFIEDSDLCDEMNYNLNCIAKDNKTDAGFFKLNLEKYPDYSKMYNVFGVPNILIFNNGKEIKRIMGVVPEHNLEKIYNKYCKKRS